MDRMTGPMVVCALVFSGSCAPALAAPKAELTARTWQLSFEFHDPQRITVPFPGESGGTTYWYLLYRVTNNTGRDVDCYPSFRLVTDTLQVVVGGEEIDPRVYGAIRERHELDYPFFVPPEKVIGRILQGEENARVSAAVFREFDTQASSFVLYVGGLSGDVTRVFSPAPETTTGGTDAEPASFLLRRTLAIQYNLPGDPITRAQATPVRRRREWVMR